MTDSRNTLLIIKKLAIDLCFLLEVNTITEIYKWSVGVTPLKATRNSDQGFTSYPDGHPSEPRDKGPRPAGLRGKSESCQPTSASLTRKHHFGECS